MIVRRARAAVDDDARRHRPAHGRGAAARRGRPCCASRRRRARDRGAARSPTACRTTSCASPPTLSPDARRAAGRARGAVAAGGRGDRARPRRRVAFELAARMAADVGSRRRRRPRVARDVVDDALRPGATPRTATTASRPASTCSACGAIKGLEFDAVVVIEPAAILAERPDGGRGGLYTALTRSTRALAVVHSQPLPFTAPDLHPVPAAEPATAWAAGRRTSTAH